MKKIMALILGSMCLLVLTACRNTVNKEKKKNGLAQIANPFTDCADLEQANELAGFAFSVPETIAEQFERSSIRVIKKKMMEVNYKNGNDEICLRKAVGKEDISGYYVSDDGIKETEVNGTKLTVKSTNGKQKAASWTDGTYAYAIIAKLSGGELNTDMIADLMKMIR